MKIQVKVHTNSSQEKLIKLDEKKFEIWIKQKPIGGKANFYLERLLKGYFGKNVRLIKGVKSKNKIFEIIN